MGKRRAAAYLSRDAGFGSASRRFTTRSNGPWMGHRVKHYPSQLSGGQQQRVAVARALGGDPAILLADEPTGNLDSANGEAVMDLLRELHRGGATICMVTHDPRYARLADRSIHLFDGRVVEEMTQGSEFAAAPMVAVLKACQPARSRLGIRLKRARVGLPFQLPETVTVAKAEIECRVSTRRGVQLRDRRVDRVAGAVDSRECAGEVIDQLGECVAGAGEVRNGALQVSVQVGSFSILPNRGRYRRVPGW